MLVALLVLAVAVVPAHPEVISTALLLDSTLTICIYTRSHKHLTRINLRSLGLAWHCWYRAVSKCGLVQHFQRRHCTDWRPLLHSWYFHTSFSLLLSDPSPRLFSSHSLISCLFIFLSFFLPSLSSLFLFFSLPQKIGEQGARGGDGAGGGGGSGGGGGGGQTGACCFNGAGSGGGGGGGGGQGGEVKK